LDIEQIPRMLSVKSSNQFPRIEFGKRNDLDFRETELFLYDWPHSLQLDRMDCTPKNGGHFDLDLGVSLANKDEGSVRVGVIGDDAVRDRFANLLGNTIQRRSYPHKRCLSIFNWEVHQINVHREAGQVSNEKIDRCPTLESEASLGRYIW
jgi:hypothetical protein